MIRVILADDHQLFLQGVKTVLEEMASLSVIESVQSGSALLKIIQAREVDLIILDLNMPGTDGLKCLQIIKQEKPQVKILVLTNYDQPKLVEEVKKLKADGFMIKSSSASELKNAVATIISGQTFFPETKDPFPREDNSYFFDDFLKKFKLTKREVHIIQLICKGYTSKQIAAELHISEFTVKTHRKNIQAKLDLKNVAGLIAFAKEHNLVD